MESAIITAIATIIAALIGIIPWLNKKNTETKNRVDRLFYLTMSGPMYENLLKLAENKFTNYVKSSGLERELYHLRDIGYIEIMEKSNFSIKAIPESGNNLQQYINVTDIGLEFVKARKSLNDN